jgi:hypothetical protein
MLCQKSPSNGDLKNTLIVAGRHIDRQTPFKGTHYRLPNAFQGKHIALRQTKIEGAYDIYFRHHFIKSLDTKAK